MKHLFLIAFGFFPLMALCQVESRQPIIFDSGNASERQVENLEQPQVSHQAVNVRTVQRNTLQFAPASGTANNLSISLPLIANPDTGHLISVKITQTNTAGVTINLNSFGPAPLYKYATLPLDSGDLEQGMIINAIYDGAAYQLLTPVSQGCPPGFVKVTKDFCIQANENDTADFYLAVKDCYDQGARLCTVSEWYYACLATGLGINDMTDNLEWVDSASNSYSQAQAKGIDQFGTPGCARGATQNVVTVNKYRCCYSR